MTRAGAPLYDEGMGTQRTTGRAAQRAGAAELRVTPEQVIAFRLERLGLARRSRDVRSAAREVGLPDFPPGAALAALAPRLDVLSPRALDDAFERREVVRARAMRGAPVVVRSEDYDVFVSGVLPRDEASMRAFVGPAMTSVKAAGMSALDAVDLVTNEATRALSKRSLDRDALHAELRRRLPEGLLPWCRACESHHVHPSLLYAVALRGRFVLFPRDDGPYVVSLARRWLERVEEVEHAPAELVRRFLRAYGPASVGELAAWAGVGGGQAKTMWKAVEGELVPVVIDGSAAKRFVLRADREALLSAKPAPVRIVSPGDPVLQMRDRDTLVPAALQRIVWKNLAPTGLLFAGARVAGVVRAKKKGQTLDVAIERVGKVDAKVRAAAEEEAARLAALRGAKLALSWT